MLAWLTTIYKQHILTLLPLYRMADTTAPAPPITPAFSFGLISDIQYADADPRFNYSKTEYRQYRHALQMTERAINTWKTHSNKISFIVHCGDLIDGLTATEKGHTESEIVLQQVMLRLEGRRRDEEKEDEDEDDHPRFPVYHMLGNHELYNFDRDRWKQELRLNKLAKLSYQLPSQTTHKRVNSIFPRLPDDDQPEVIDSICYYSIQPHPLYCLIMLDSYDISVLGWPSSHPHHQLATELLNKYNPNTVKDSPVGLTGLDRRWVRFGGGISAHQLAWLHEQLTQAEQQHQHVIVFSHIPLNPRSCDPVGLCWNYADVLNILQQHSCVRLCIAGHDHDGGHAFDEQHQIHYVTVEGVISAQVGRDCFARVDCFADKIEIVGVDLMTSRTIALPNPTWPQPTQPQLHAGL